MKYARKLPWVLAGLLPVAGAILWCACIAVLPASSEQAMGQAIDVPAPVNDSQPTTEASDAQPWVAMIDYLRFFSLPPRQRQALRDREPQEWASLQDFLDKNCPNRSRLLALQNPVAGTPVRMRLLLRWENIVRLQHDQPALYENQIDQLKEEDELIGMSVQIRALRNRREYRRIGELRGEIQNESLKLVDLTLDERDLRIQSAQALLDKERASLQADRANRGDLARARADQIMRQTGGRGFNPANTPGFRQPPNGTNGGSEDATPPVETSPTAAGVAPANPQANH